MSAIQEFTEMLSEFGLEYFNKYYSCYRGIVKSNTDPENRGRLQVHVPQVHGENDWPSTWAESKGMPAGQQAGLYIIPQVDDMVWVTFEFGNPEHPVWEYGHPVEGEVPGAMKPTNYLFQSPKGLKVELDDATEEIRLTGVNGNTIQLYRDGRISVKNGKEDLKKLLTDLVLETVALQTISPGGAGTVNPTSAQKLLEIHTRIFKLLK